MLAVDWSHIKELTTFDGKKVRVESLKQLCKRLTKDDKDDSYPESKTALPSNGWFQGSEPVEDVVGGESMLLVQSTTLLQPPTVVLEAGCPLNLMYTLILTGARVALIDNHATENYRKEHELEKSDEGDARIIYELASNGAHLQTIDLNDRTMQLHDLYHQYCRYQKARVALGLMKKAHIRHYRGGESRSPVKSITSLHPPLDLMPYDIAIDTLEAREKSLMKRLEETYKGLPLFEAGGESNTHLQSKRDVQPPSIKGLGQRLWLGILVTANPRYFPCLSAYLRFCGLTYDAVASHRYSRHARMLYHMLAEETMKLGDEKFRPIYDKCKADFKGKHPEIEVRKINGKDIKFYTKGHIHNAALNRTATFLAKEIFTALEKRRL